MSTDVLDIEESPLTASSRHDHLRWGDVLESELPQQMDGRRTCNARVFDNRHRSSSLVASLSELFDLRVSVSITAPDTTTCAHAKSPR